MLHQNRDMEITHVRPRRNHVCYGMGLGVILVDEVYPGFPGDVRNASAYPFPIQYEIAEGLTFSTLKSDYIDSGRTPVVRAAKKLQRMGCRAIVGECGWLAYFQQDVTAQVDVPVFMSALLQVPMIQRAISADKVVGILTSEVRGLTEAMLRAVGIDPDSNIVIAGADEHGCKELDKLYHIASEAGDQISEGCYETARDELVRACTTFVEANPKMGALLFTCTGHPPFARAIQSAIDLPVLSWGTMLDYAYSVAVHRDYYGHV